MEVPVDAAETLLVDDAPPPQPASRSDVPDTKTRRNDLLRRFIDTGCSLRER
jgi:hypothetical protein